MRYEVNFVGHVQGVGFRITAHRLAVELGVVGWVRNDPDGSVQLAIEGERSQLDAFLNEMRSRLGEHVEKERLAQAEERGGYTGFEIRQ